MAEEARQLAKALAATELVLPASSICRQLDGLAAAAAHELGTPLATIALVAKEMERALPQGRPLRGGREAAARADASAAATILTG